MEIYEGKNITKSVSGSLVMDWEKDVLYFEDKDTQDRIFELGKTANDGTIAKFTDKIKITDSLGTDLMLNGKPTSDAIKGLITADIFMTNEAFLMAGDFTDNDPSAGYVSWSDIEITANGETYSITDDDTSDRYIYWVDGDTTFTTSDNMLYLNKDYIMFEDFESVTDWTQGGDASAMALYGTWKTQGADSGNLTWVNSGGTATWAKTLTTGIDCTTRKVIKMDFKCADYTKITKIGLKVGSDSSNYRLFEFIPYNNDAGELIIDIAQEGTDTGSPNWADIKYFAIIVTETASSTLYVDNLRIYKDKEAYLVAVNLSGTHRRCLGRTVINGGMIEADTLSVISAYLGSVQVGGADNVNGVLSVRDAGNNETARLDKDGVYGIAGLLGAWTLSNVAFYHDGATDATSAGMAPADYPFYAGKKYVDRATAPFNVSIAGILTAAGAVISGAVTMVTGYIGGLTGWAITANKIRTTSATNTIEAVSTGLLSNDTGFFLEGDGKVRFGTVSGGVLSQGMYNDGADVWIKSKDNKFFFKDPNSLIDYQIGAGNNLLKDHGMETLFNPRQNTINAVGVTPVIARYCLTQETTKKLDNTTSSITKMAQSFTWNGDADDFCSGVWLKLTRTQILMLGGNFTMRLETDNAGSPSGTLANASATVAIDERYIGGTTFDDPQSLFYFPFPTGFTLTNGTRYWAVWYAAGLSGTDYFNFKHDNASDSYADGSSKYYDGAWKSYTGDFYFGIQAWTNDTTGWVENVYNNEMDLFNQEWDITNQVRAVQPDYNQINFRIRPNWYTEGFPYISRLLFGGYVLTGLQNAVVDNLNYVYQIACMNVIASKEYTFSANIGTWGGNQNTNAAAISAILKIEAFKTDGDGSLTSLGSTTETTVITASFSAATDDPKVIRAKCNYTLPATTTFVKVSVYSASTEKIRTDAWKLEQASYPSVYNEESSLWRHCQGRGIGNEHTMGSIRLPMLASEAWTSFTTTLGGGLGGSATQNNAYIKIGRTVIARYDIVTTISTTFSANPFTFSLPVTAISYGNASMLGQLYIEDKSTAGYIANLRFNSTTTVMLIAIGTAGSYGGTANVQQGVPFTFSTGGDIMRGWVIYEAAS